MPSPNPNEDVVGILGPCSVSGSHVAFIVKGRVRSRSARAYSPV
jgi:hypothetical protein